jgi:hypothetical protein
MDNCSLELKHGLATSDLHDNCMIEALEDRTVFNSTKLQSVV